MSRVLPFLALLVLTIYCVVDCVQTEEGRVRNLPKFAWVLLILIFPLVGSIAWLLAGRPSGQPAAAPAPRRPGPPPRSLAPDDDPHFLAGLDASADERRRLAAWEQELRVREAELRAPPAPRDPTARHPSSHDPAPRTTAPRDPAARDAVPREAGPRDAVPRDAVPRDAVPRDGGETPRDAGARDESSGPDGADGPADARP